MRAARAVGGDLVGVGLLPRLDGGWTALEVNGAVDFTADYSLPAGDVFDEVGAALALAPAVPAAAGGRV